MRERVDLIVLTRDAGPLRPPVQAGIAAQQGVRIKVHRVVGTPAPGDRCRWESIARARNRGAKLGDAPWLMFLDDDVVLAPQCIRELVRRLSQRPAHGALAADYLGESVSGASTRHVAMGATLFRRSALRRIRFRWEERRCECQCCCDDLRRRGMGIAYCPTAHARHLKSVAPRDHTDKPSTAGADPDSDGVASPLVLTVFDRNHCRLFQQQFLRSLRSSGNRVRVTVVGYGLYPSQRRALERIRGVEVLARPCSPARPARRRLRDFQAALAPLAEDTPVAYWDAGDTIFQDSLDALWDIVREHPDELLVVREPYSHPENRTVRAWTSRIRNPIARHRAFEMISKRPFLNGGFAAGTARAMLTYLRRADRLRDSTALRGCESSGDQLTLNFYCYAKKGRWREVEQGWNYCLSGRDAKQLYLRRDGRLASRLGEPIHVIHGNGSTLRVVAQLMRPRSQTQPAWQTR